MKVHVLGFEKNVRLDQHQNSYIHAILSMTHLQRLNVTLRLASTARASAAKLKSGAETKKRKQQIDEPKGFKHHPDR